MAQRIESTINFGNDIKLLIIGPEGQGKSSVGNFILSLSTKPFPEASGLLQGTTSAQMSNGTINGMNIAVVDTPKFDWRSRSYTGGRQSCVIPDGLEKSKLRSDFGSPAGFDAVLYVISADCFYSKESRRILESASDEMNLWPYLIVIITKGKSLADNSRQQKQIFEAAYTNDNNSDLHWLINKSKKRYIILECKDYEKSHRETQKRNLLEFIRNIQDSNYKMRYTGDRLKFCSISLLIIGVPGGGKSAFGNFLLGSNAFNCSTGVLSKISSPQQHSTFRNGVKLSVTETQGFGSGPDWYSETVLKNALLLTNGPLEGVDAITFVLSANMRFTQDQQDTLELLHQKEKFWNRVIVVITHAKEMGESVLSQEQAVKELMESPESPQSLKWLLSKVSRRFLTVELSTHDNLCEEYENERFQKFMLVLEQVFKKEKGQFTYRHFQGDKQQSFCMVPDSIRSGWVDHVLGKFSKRSNY